MILGIDIGNTFTDFVLLNDQGFRTVKILSTPDVPEQAVLKGIEVLGLTSTLQSSKLLITHSNNTVDNALEAIGAKVVSVENYRLAIAHFLTTHLNQSILLTFDMGGTSTHIALIENKMSAHHKNGARDNTLATSMTDQYMVDIGGNSIAYIDEKGLLQVGPHSIGAVPGPACYGFGGDQPTVTDANLMLGRLRSDHLLGGTIRPDINSARMALAKLAHPLNMRIENVALTIINIANEKIAATLKPILDDVDPMQFTLCAVGSGGGLHACAVADALNIKNVIIPQWGGVFSAFGVLTVAEPGVRLPLLDYKKNRASHQRIQLYGITLPVSVWSRYELSPEEMIMGPAIIVEETTTIFLQNGWLAYVDSYGHLLLRRMAIDVY